MKLWIMAQGAVNIKLKSTYHFTFYNVWQKYILNT